MTLEVRFIPLDASASDWWAYFPHLFEDGWTHQWAFPVDARGDKLSEHRVEVPRPEWWAPARTCMLPTLCPSAP